MEILLVNMSKDLFHDYRYHSHGYWEIIYNTYGSGTAVIAGQEYPFAEGTIFCVPPDTLHSKSASGGFTDACVFIRDFTPLAEGRISCLADDGDQTFKKLLQMAYDIQLKDEVNAKAIINALGDAMYQLLAGWSALSRRPGDPAESFRNLLTQHISNPRFDLAAEVEKTGYSDSYFRKLFKAFTGYSPLSYLNHLRIEFAKRQIQQYHGMRPIKEIALTSGFSDPYYFSRLFKQHEGVSPQQYAQNLGSFDRERLFLPDDPRRIAASLR